MGITVPSEACVAELAWTGVETTFSPGFKALLTGHVSIVYRNALDVEYPLTQGVHYSVSIDSAGSVTVTPIALPVPPGTLIVGRNTPALQATDFENLVGFAPKVHTDLHSAAAMRDAEIRRDITGKASFAPVLAVVADGNRRVHQVVAWIGGLGPAPDVGVYVGADGYVDAIADAVDIRGPAGAPGPGTGDASGPASAVDGNVALFDGASGKLLKDGGSFASLLAGAALDNETSVAGANPCDIGAAATTRILITGGAGNVSFSVAAKRLRIVRFPAGKVLQHNATSLVLLAGANRTTAAGDQGIYISDATGNWRELAFSRADGKAVTTSIVDADVATDLITPRMLAAAAVAQGVYMLNGTIVVSRTGNAETAAIKTLAGTDPSAADPVLCFFPNATGGYQRAKITAATSLTINNTATLGCTNSVAFNLLWTLHLDPSGPTVRLGVIQCKNSSNDILSVDAFGVANTALSDNAADNAQIFYSTAALSGAPFIVIGRSAYAGLATAGVWNTAPATTRLAGPGFVLPGRPINEKLTFFTSTNATAAAALTFVDTGVQVTNYKVQDPANLVWGVATLCVGYASNSSVMFKALRDAVTLDMGDAAGIGSRTRVAAAHAVPSSTIMTTASLQFRDAPNDVSGHTYKIQYAPDTANAAFINRTSPDTDAAPTPRAVSSISVREIQA